MSSAMQPVYYNRIQEYSNIFSRTSNLGPQSIIQQFKWLHPRPTSAGETWLRQNFISSEAD